MVLSFKILVIFMCTLYPIFIASHKIDLRIIEFITHYQIILSNALKNFIKCNALLVNCVAP